MTGLLSRQEAEGRNLMGNATPRPCLALSKLRWQIVESVWDQQCGLHVARSAGVLST